MIFNMLAAQTGGGAGGLEYETGTYTPTYSDVVYTIPFSNTHTEPPVFVFACIKKNNTTYDNSTGTFIYVDTLAFADGQISSSIFGFVFSTAGTSNSSKLNITTRYNDPNDSHTQTAGYYISSTGFKPRYVNNSNISWSTSYPIEWIAIWK